MILLEFRDILLCSFNFRLCNYLYFFVFQRKDRMLLNHKNTYLISLCKKKTLDTNILLFRLSFSVLSENNFLKEKNVSSESSNSKIARLSWFSIYLSYLFRQKNAFSSISVSSKRDNLRAYSRVIELRYLRRLNFGLRLYNKSICAARFVNDGSIDRLSDPCWCSGSRWYGRINS